MESNLRPQGIILSILEEQNYFFGIFDDIFQNFGGTYVPPPKTWVRPYLHRIILHQDTLSVRFIYVKLAYMESHILYILILM
jgi:hypothetical protein